MSLNRSKNLFYLAAIAIAIILDCTGDMIGWVAAIVVLAGAPPVFHAVIRATLNAVESRSHAHASRAKTHEEGSQGHDRHGTLPGDPR